MPKPKTTSIEIGFKEKLQHEGDRCERAILNRLYAAPARIEDLDTLGFPKPLTNRVLNALLHQERVVSHGFTYFYHYLRSLQDQSPTEKIEPSRYGTRASTKTRYMRSAQSSRIRR